MNIILKIKFIIYLIFILCNSSCSQHSSDKILGEWMVEISDDGDWLPDVIIFRSDNKYLIFNDLDFVWMIDDTLPEFSILMDERGAVTALTETGSWIYNESSNQIILTERNFIKENSLFNEYYGKGDKLIFEVKNITFDSLDICYREKKCDTYIKNYNPGGNRDMMFYREQVESYIGNGSQENDIYLSGYETELKISYNFFEEADQLTVTDKNGKELFSTKMESTNERIEKEISIRGVTNLIFRINSSKPNSKWELELDIK